MPPLPVATIELELPEPIEDLDVDDLAEFVALSRWKGFHGQAELWPPPNVYVGGFTSFPAPEDCTGGWIRGLNDGRILIVGQSARSKRDRYAWIVSWDGELDAEFIVGDDWMWDVLVLDDAFVVIHDDEQRDFADMKGIRAYGCNGELLYSYEHVFGCYAACATGPRSFLYVPFFKDSACHVDLDAEGTGETYWPIPKKLRLPLAISTVGEVTYFWRPYNDRDGVYRWKLGSEDCERIADAQDWLAVRGLTGGRFLYPRQDSYNIVYAERST
ncbi:hypothetical protein FIV42_00795 [Persicimonas caeni]|uniref:Uncharacterized protein n=1 Tax=Persicimonas caeni TaxID=2292766 RepID=A0A4Y6PM28_PERCE|nr:hypothetical protein [Persicimonas caeni]QDG49322.1 hypothetical protein FIV42_00795 [Persicimonas caeni]QED30543.1 hypothetical protein FRD00_00790 [Persicimonas caeni]